MMDPVPPEADEGVTDDIVGPEAPSEGATDVDTLPGGWTSTGSPCSVFCISSLNCATAPAEEEILGFSGVPVLPLKTGCIPFSRP